MDTMTNKQLENELKQWKAKDEAHRARRAEIMSLLHNDGASMPKIAKMYGCKRQFVQQEIKRHQEQKAT